MNSLKPPLLVTTALEETFGVDDAVLFLGEWCRHYGRDAAFENRETSVVRYHWDDRTKLRHDYNYLKGLHDLLLEQLARFLNDYHTMTMPLQYWRIILDPWLVHYVSVIYDRWECLRVAFEDGRKFATLGVTSKPGALPPFDFSDFFNKSVGDNWNHNLFLEIIRSQYGDQCDINELPSLSLRDEEIGDKLKPRRKTLKRVIALFSDKILRLLSNSLVKSRVVLFSTYFPPVALARLSLKLGQIPRFYFDEFDWPGQFEYIDETKIDCSARDKFKFIGSRGNSFETFLSRRVAKDLPYVYFEGFLKQRSRVNHLPFHPKVIVSAVGHWGNEIFKLWSAENAFIGCKIVSVQHGGSINIGTMIAMEFEENISDYYATPALPCHHKHIRLPFVKSAGVRKKSGGEFCSLIGFDSLRYAFRAEAAPIAGQVLINYQQSIDFYNHLSGDVKRKFRVRPRPSQIEQMWNTRQRYIDDLGIEKLSKEVSYHRFLKKSRLIVCTYPNTSFAESMTSGIPTLLLYPSHLWELSQDKNGLLQILIGAQILFYDPKAAACHVNAIWQNVGHWWRSPEVINARVEFSRQAVHSGNDWLNEWTAFLKGI